MVVVKYGKNHTIQHEVRRWVPDRGVYDRKAKIIGVKDQITARFKYSILLSITHATTTF